MHPTYLHDMWCQSTRILGNAATFQEIAMQINLQSAVLPDRPQLDKFKLWRWFKKNKGEKRRKVSRSLLTELHKERRLTYAQDMLERIEIEEEITFYKDEKWAYEESKRKYLKYLSCADFKQFPLTKMRNGLMKNQNANI